jgi:hypothetical protein
MFLKSALALLGATLCLSQVPVMAQAPGQRSALPPQDCDRACLLGFLHGYLDAMKSRDPGRLALAPDVRYTENNVEMPLGRDGIWATVTGVAGAGLEAADVKQGEVAWIGAVDERGAPVYFGMRMQVRDRRITEVESVVVRNSGLPLPWGDFSKLEHDPAFSEILPDASRKPRERLRAVADSYFNTVELNDGTVFAPFHEECGRIENGISTTRASALAAPGGQGNASSISPGCEAQFKLGIYYINKRIRERRYPVIDEERGVVVATGFFDHANGFDRYRLTDGREMKTALKWPNSISLVEAFKIVDGRIYRIETVFSYVPYFMPSPYYLHPQPPAPAPAAKKDRARETACDVACMERLGDRVVAAMAARRPQDIPWSTTVRYSENGVPMEVGDGLWASIRSVAASALRVADPKTGNVAWYGLVYDHDAPAYAGLRIRLVDGRVAEVEAVVARERSPGPWLAPAKFQQDEAFAVPLERSRRSVRQALIAIVEAHARSLWGQAAARGKGLAADAVRRSNGTVLGEGQDYFGPLERLRGQRVVAVDESRGLVVTQSLADYPQRDPAVKSPVSYPLTRELFEVHRIEAGKITRLDAVSVFQPYRMGNPYLAKEKRP